MSKLVTYQGCQLTPQTKIAVEALTLQAERMGLKLVLEKGEKASLAFKEVHAFLKHEAHKYGFVNDEKNQHIYHFVGIKKQAPSQ